MKQVLLLLVFILGYGDIVLAQQWNCVSSNDTMYFLDAAGQYKALLTTDSVVEPSFTSYKMYRTIKLDRACNAAAASQETYNSQYPTWSGFKVHREGNGDFTFFNRYGQPITIKPLTNLGDRWTMFIDSNANFMYAEVAAKDTATIFGSTIDSVKTIRFLVPFSTNAKTKQWDSVEFKLSANYGLLEAPFFLEFPNIKVVYRRTFLEPLRWSNVYGFQVGDYYQTKTINYGPQTPVEQTSYDYYEYLVRDETNGGNTVNFKIYHEHQVKVGNYVSEVTVDTLYKTYNSMSAFVGTGIPEGRKGNNINMDYQNSSGKRSNTTINYFGFRVSADSCMTEFFTDIDKSNPYYYECFVALYNYSGIGGRQDQYVVYSNICGNTSGAKVVLTPRPNDVAILIDGALSICPNPATDQIKIENSTQIGLGMRIFNLHGQLLADFGKLQQGEHVIPVYEYPVGLYVLEITGNGETVYQKIAIAR